MEEYISLSDVAKNLNGISWDILDILSKKENVSYKDLKNYLKISHEKCSKEIARLEGALLIQEKTDPRDQRVSNFNITENGLKACKYKSL